MWGVSKREWNLFQGLSQNILLGIWVFSWVEKYDNLKKLDHCSMKHHESLPLEGGYIWSKLKHKRKNLKFFLISMKRCFMVISDYP